MMKKMFGIKISIYGFIFMILLLFLADGISAEDKIPFRVPEVEGKVKVDGVMDEDVWQNALRLELKYEVTPGENIPPPVRTEVYLAYSKTRFYIGFRAYDPDPSAIRARLTDRDNILDDDWVGITLDTFNDHRRTYSFLCNPLGIQAESVDISMSETNFSWDTIWSSAGRIVHDGYIVEIAIPFSSLRFQRTRKEQVWGCDILRWYPRSLAHGLGVFPRDRSNNCYMCQMEKLIGFKGVKAGKNIEIDPSVSALVTREREHFTEGKWIKKDSRVDPGITAHWAFTPNMTLSAAVNPDFSHVEADVAQLDINTQFALFYPEKRPFFLEGTGIFDTRFAAVYTRSLADPDWGIKLSGKEGPHAIGFYSVRDNITNLLFPGSRSSDTTSLDMKTIGSVLRYRLDVGQKSTVGLLLTDREGSDYFNRLLGVDTHLRIDSKKHIKFQFLVSRSSYPDQVVTDFGQTRGAFTGTALDLLFKHESRNFDYHAFYQQVSPGFRADLGFMPHVGYRLFNGGLTFSWWSNPGNWYTYIDAKPELEYEVDDNNNLIYKKLSVTLNYQGPKQSVLTLWGSLGKQSYLENIFDTNHGGFFFNIQPSSALKLGLNGIFGDHIDFANSRQATRIYLNPFILYKMGKHFSINLDHIFEWLNVEAGKLYNANVSNLKLVYQFSRRAFLRTIFQYVNYNYNVENYFVSQEPRFKHLFTQVLFSYKINPQTMLFLGYSDDYYGFVHVPLTQTNRTVFLKIGYALIL